MYDTASERNPAVLRTCRRYLRWTQRSVFHGEVSPAQLRTLESELAGCVDHGHDSIILFVVSEGAAVQRRTMGLDLGFHDTII